MPSIPRRILRDRAYFEVGSADCVEQEDRGRSEIALRIDIVLAPIRPFKRMFTHSITPAIHMESIVGLDYKPFGGQLFHPPMSAVLRIARSRLCNTHTKPFGDYIHGCKTKFCH